MKRHLLFGSYGRFNFVKIVIKGESVSAQLHYYNFWCSGYENGICKISFKVNLK